MNILQSRSFPRPSLERVTLLAILLLAFALRVYRLGAQAIWWDESLSVYRATRDLGTILSNTILIQNVVTVDTLPPLYFVLLRAVVSTAGRSEFALRWLSVTANVATVSLLYVLARQWFTGRAGRAIGLVAAFMGTLAPFYVWYAQEARPYALVLFWSTLAVYALTRRWAVVYVLAAAAAIYTHYFAVFLIPFHFVLLALARPRPRWRWLFLPALPLASAVFLVPMVLASLAGNAGTGPYFVPLDIILRDILNSFSVGITVDPAQVLWIDLALLALFIFGVFEAREVAREGPPAAILVPAYILVPVLAMFVITFIRPLYQNSRYLIATSPAFYLGVAAGTVALARRWQVLAIPALALFLAGALLSLNNLYFNPQYGKDDHRAWADYLAEHVRPGDFIILDSPHTEELFQYYTPAALPWMSLPILRADRTPSPDADLAAVRDAYRQHPRVWLLTMNVPFDDPEARVEKMMNSEGVLLDRVEIAGTSTEIGLGLYAPALPVANTAQIAHPLDAAFGGHLVLRGYNAPATIAAGTHATVQLYWALDEPVGEDYALSLRLIDTAGTRAAQWDGVILGNRAGTSTWRAGTLIADTRDLALPPGVTPGAYTLAVVPYHAATGAALGDVVTLGAVQVVANGGSR